MSAYELPAWLDIRFIENALSRTAAPDKAELRDILDKSLALKSLTIQEATALMRVTDPEDIALMMKTADAVKQKAYGDRIVLRCISRTIAAVNASTAPTARAIRSSSAST